MRHVIADTGPLHYLVLIGEIELLPRLLDSVTIPSVVRDELDQPSTPMVVRAWIASPPPWLSIADNMLPVDDPAVAALDDGERAVIALAGALRADLLLIDDRAGVAAARARGFAVTGTPGLLDRAARKGWLDLSAGFAALRATNFHASRALLDAILAAWEANRNT